MTTSGLSCQQGKALTPGNSCGSCEGVDGCLDELPLGGSAVSLYLLLILPLFGWQETKKRWLAVEGNWICPEAVGFNSPDLAQRDGAANRQAEKAVAGNQPPLAV